MLNSASPKNGRPTDRFSGCRFLLNLSVVPTCSACWFEFLKDTSRPSGLLKALRLATIYTWTKKKKENKKPSRNSKCVKGTMTPGWQLSHRFSLLWRVVEMNTNILKVFPDSSVGKKICLQCRRPGFDPWVGKIPWRKERLPTPVFWPGEFHGLYSSWGREELDMTEWLPLSKDNRTWKLIS